MRQSTNAPSDAGDGGDDASGDGSDQDSELPQWSSGAYSPHERFTDEDDALDLRKFEYRYWPVRYGVSPREIPRLPVSGRFTDNNIPELTSLVADAADTTNEYGRVKPHVIQTLHAWLGYFSLNDKIDVDELEKNWRSLRQQLHDDARGAMTAATVAFRLATDDMEASPDVLVPDTAMDIDEISSSRDIGGIVTVRAVVKSTSEQKSRVAAIRGNCDGPDHTIVAAHSPTSDDIPTFDTCPHCAENDVQSTVYKNDEHRVDTSDGKVRAVLGSSTDTDEKHVVIEEDVLDTLDSGDRVRMVAVVDFREDGSAIQDIVLLPLAAVKTTQSNVTVTEEDRDEFAEFRDEHNGDVVNELAAMIAPHLIAPSDERDGQYERARRAIIYQLAGCHNEALHDGDDASAVRPMIHALIVGPPSTGKSDLVEAAQRIAPVGEYVDGTAATKAGVTAVTEQQETLRGGSEWILRAGKVPMASGGIAAIDEADDLNEETLRSLQIPMESGIVDISKAGSGRIPAETSVLMSANPAEDAWDSYTSIVKQLPDNLSDTILSRADVIMRLHDDRTDRARVYEQMRAGKHGHEDAEEVYDWLQRYIAEAQSYTPTFTDNAWTYTNEIATELLIAGGDKIQVDNRDADTIRRLAVAHARLLHRQKVTEDDVQAASEYIVDSIRDIAENEYGEVDPSGLRGTGRAERLSREQVEVIASTLIALSEDDYVDRDYLEEAVEEVVPEDMVDDAISAALSDSGVLHSAGRYGLTVNNHVDPDDRMLVDEEELADAVEQVREQ